MDYLQAKPKVSIVVPVYNQEKYLQISIPSMINQLYENIEIILVNDGSTDSSAEILEKFAQTDKRIKVYEKQNGGLVDATIYGIRNATGDYVCFLDPDDRIGEDYVLFFLKHIEKDEDFVAAGFYYENGKMITPYYLKESKRYTNDQIDCHRDDFLFDENECSISNRFFVSRWNKMYKMDCIRKVVEEFKNCKEVSLGEDTIFTFLVLCNSRNGRTISVPNSYYYNIGNQNSMMKSGSCLSYLEKCKKAFQIFGEILQKNNGKIVGARELYYLLTERIYNSIDKNSEEFEKAYCLLKKDKEYVETLRLIAKRCVSLKKKAETYCRLYVNSPRLYIYIFKQLWKSIKKAKVFIFDIVYILKSIIKKGIYEGIYSYIFMYRRREAYVGVEKYLPLIEKRVTQYLKPYLNKKSDLNECTIEKNIFVFWWDGFGKAPIVVKKCLDSVKKHHKDYRIIEISKENYWEYTDIHPVILEDFKKGKISIQTFSDILRFNLLKNSGGTWIDATIFFAKEFNMQKGLENKPFESLKFLTSEEFLQYKGEKASWSGFYIASRKNSVFVQAINDIFEKYYVEYRTYTTYFFIDAVLMICKINHLDGGVLDYTLTSQGDMFALAKVLDKEYVENYMDYVMEVPQKLRWMVDLNTLKENTFLEKVVLNENENI